MQKDTTNQNRDSEEDNVDERSNQKNAVEQERGDVKQQQLFENYQKIIEELKITIDTDLPVRIDPISTDEQPQMSSQFTVYTNQRSKMNQLRKVLRDEQEQITLNNTKRETQLHTINPQTEGRFIQEVGDLQIESQGPVSVENFQENHNDLIQKSTPTSQVKGAKPKKGKHKKNKKRTLKQLNSRGSRDSLLMSSRESYITEQEGDLEQAEIELRFQEPDYRQIHIEALKRFKENDVKGVRRTLYLKQISNYNQNILGVRDKSRYDQVNDYYDKLPCLEFRKILMKIRELASYVSYTIIKSKAFEIFFLFIIAANSLMLAFEDPTSKAKRTFSQNFVEVSFLILYTLELVLKVMGLGLLLNKGAYLRDSWNIVDAIIVVTAYLQIIFDESSIGNIHLSGVRVFRVLRPLRAIQRVEGLKVLVTALLTALPLLRDTLIILLFFFFIYACTGVQFLAGILKRRCINVETGIEHEDDIYCGGTQSCPTSYFCGKRFQNPNEGVTNFDNILYGMLTIFQCVTLEGWSTDMNYVAQVQGAVAYFYFIPLVFIGAFFLLNLTLAVINSKFNEAHKAQIQANLQKKLNKQIIDYELDDNIKNDILTIRKYNVAKNAAKQMIHFMHLMRSQKHKASKHKTIKIKGVLNDDLKNIIDEQLKNEKTRSDSKSNFSQSENLGLLQNESEVIQTSLSQQYSTKGTSPNNKSRQRKTLDRLSIVKNFIHSAQKPNLIEEGKALPTNINFYEDEQVLDRSKYETIHEEDNEEEEKEATFIINKEKHIHQDLEYVLGKTIENQQQNRDQYTFRKRGNFIENQQPNSKINRNSQALMQEKANYSPFLRDEDLLVENNPMTPDHNEERNIYYVNDQDTEIQIEYQNDQQGIKVDNSHLKSPSNNYESEKLEESFNILDCNEENESMGPIVLNDQKQDELKIENPGIKKKWTINQIAPDQRDKDILGDNNNKHKRHFESSLSVGHQQEENIDKMINSLDKGNELNNLANDFRQKRQLSMISSTLRSIVTKPPSEVTIQIQPKKQQIGAARQRGNQVLPFLEKGKSIFTKIEQSMKEKYVTNIRNEKSKAIEIIPNVNYQSTSQNEILVRKHENDQTTKLLKLYPFVKVQKKYTIDEELYFIKVTKEPYMQKVIYEALPEELENLDEQRLLAKAEKLAELQPYETVTLIGNKGLLDKVATYKQITRKTMIIVSSTLSLTIQPQFYDQEEENYDENNLFNEAFGVEPKIIEGEDNYIENLRKNSEKEKNLQIQYQQCLNENVTNSILSRLFKLQPIGSRKFSSLISESQSPESKKKKTILSGIKYDIKNRIRKELLSRNYKPKQKQFRFTQQFRQKQEELQRRSFTVVEAKKIFSGTFYAEDDEEEDKFEKKKREMEEKVKHMKEKTEFQGISIFNDRDQEALLDQFESQKKDIMQRQREIERQQQVLDSEDEAPIEIKEELGLPPILKDLEIDQYKVRKMDELKKRKRFTWSGKDVLDDKIQDIEEKYVIDKLNSIRVQPQGVRGCMRIFRAYVRNFIKSSFYENFMLLSVLTNTVVLAMDRINISEEDDNILQRINLSFTALFILELLVKFLALGPRKYLKDRMNYLDGSIVLMSIVELAITADGTGAGKSSLSALRSIRFFRTIRVLRVARLLRMMRQMQVIVDVLQKSVYSFIYIAILLILFMFIYALLGMQIFGGKFDFEDGVPRANFDTFNSAFITTFQVLTIESWYAILYNSMRSDLGKIIPTFYYISWIFIGNFIILNLFLSILIDSFTMNETDDKLIQEIEQQEELRKLEQQALENKVADKGKSEDLSLVKTLKRNERRRERLKKQKNKNKNYKIMKLFTQRRDKTDIDSDLEDLDQEEIHNIFKEEGLVDNHQMVIDYETQLMNEVECEKSLYLFAKDSRIRIFFYTMTKHRFFERVVLGVIVLSSLKLAVDTYLIDQPEKVKISDYIDIGLTIFFIAESLSKSIAIGFLQDNGSYLRESWNIADFLIAVTSLIDLCLPSINIPIIKILRLLRVLRPLRFISHNIAMKMMITALFESLGSILNVMFLVVIVWLMFAIIGVNLFAGKFSYCSKKKYLIATEEDCLDQRGEWETYQMNFDNVGRGIITLFVVASEEDWPDVMNAAQDSYAVGFGPQYNYSKFSAYYFIIFILIGSYFFLNLIIAVLFQKYNEAQIAENKGFTEQQLQWIDMQKMILDAKPDFESTNLPQQKWRRKVHWFVGNNKFDFFITFCIICNMIQMACAHEGASEEFSDALDKVNITFTMIFALEFILKMIAYGGSYFKNNWNIFDFIVICTSYADIIMSLLTATSLRFLRIGPQIGRVLRVLRVTRVLRLIGKYEGLQALIQTITFSLPQLLNVLGLLLVILFMFAILGVFFFREITSGEIIDESFNFSNFGNAMLILFRMSTGEDWCYIMFDCMNTSQDCIPGKNCGSMYAPVYFLSFIVIVTYIMLQLFILVIIQQFDKYYLPKDNVMNKFKQDLVLFKETWKQFTQERYNCQKLKEKQLPLFLQTLRAPLGMSNQPEKEVRKNMMVMSIRQSADGYIHFNELLYRCMKRAYCQFKLTKTMQIIEFKTQYKILIQTLVQEKKGRTVQNEELLQTMRDTAHSVNPFLTLMYYRMAFKQWNLFMKFNKNFERRKSHFISSRAASDRSSQILINTRSSSPKLIKPKTNMFSASYIYFEYESDESILITDNEEEQEENSLHDLYESPIKEEDIKEGEYSSSSDGENYDTNRRLQQSDSMEEEIKEDSQNMDRIQMDFINKEHKSIYQDENENNESVISISQNIRKSLVNHKKTVSIRLPTIEDKLP